MSGLPRIADDIKHLVQSGKVCASCGCEFVQPHGHRVACGFCRRHGEHSPIATHEETAVHEGKKRSRQKRDG